MHKPKSFPGNMDDRRFIKEVLSYYEKSGRHDLTWRKKITPYKILVSEIMLQQTQVPRVLPKFTAWMKAYPTLSALSKASLTDVLKLWQGLGYQRRAKALYDMARSVRTIPKDYSELLALKGVGPYTASALCAFAYDTFPDRLLETNIRTALIEAFHQGEANIHDGRLYDDLSRLTKNKVVQKAGARTWYCALMDYGAYLKSMRISHNEKSVHNTRQSPYAGSLRQLRARVLFAITHKEKLPRDERLPRVLEQLATEGYIIKNGRKFSIQ
ncbi:MAG: A/G-specific adenine glycosylase [Minisyncoccia bacterium]